MGLADARHCFAAFDLGTRALPDAGLCFTAFDLGHRGHGGWVWAAGGWRRWLVS